MNTKNIYLPKSVDDSRYPLLSKAIILPTTPMALDYRLSEETGKVQEYRMVRYELRFTISDEMVRDNPDCVLDLFLRQIDGRLKKVKTSPHIVAWRNLFVIERERDMMGYGDWIAQPRFWIGVYP